MKKTILILTLTLTLTTVKEGAIVRAPIWGDKKITSRETFVSFYKINHRFKFWTFNFILMTFSLTEKKYLL